MTQLGELLILENHALNTVSTQVGTRALLIANDVIWQSG